MSSEAEDGGLRLRRRGHREGPQKGLGRAALPLRREEPPRRLHEGRAVITHGRLVPV